jgi:hypothetical protein
MLKAFYAIVRGNTEEVSEMPTHWDHIDLGEKVGAALDQAAVMMVEANVSPVKAQLEQVVAAFNERQKFLNDLFATLSLDAAQPQSIETIIEAAKSFVPAQEEKAA